MFLQRRPTRGKYKAGNIAHFLEQRGHNYDFFLVLDADSVMSGRTVRRLICQLEARPEVAVLQSTVMPVRSVTPFARALEYSTRRSLPLYARGMRWFLGRDSVYWGHNALIWYFVGFLGFVMLFPRLFGLIRICKDQGAPLLREVVATDAEFLISLLVSPLIFYMHSVFIFGILIGNEVRWESQARGWTGIAWKTGMSYA